MKILVANISAVEENSKAGRFVKEVMAPVQLKNFMLTAEKNDEFIARFPKTGMTNPDFSGNQYVMHINLGALYHQSVQAEKEGFDAVILTCVFDPCLPEARRAVKIPVVGLCESTLMMASMMGGRFGLISPTPALNDPLRSMVADYGMRDRIVALRTMTIPWERQELAFFDAQEVIDDFQRVARELIKEGAEVLVPLCGLLSPLVRMAPGLQDVYPHGITDIDGIPIADVMGSAMATLKALSTMKRSSSGWHNPNAFGNKIRLVGAMGGPSEDIPEFWDLKYPVKSNGGLHS